jgi:hypothetical protein
MSTSSHPRPFARPALFVAACALLPGLLTKACVATTRHQEAKYGGQIADSEVNLFLIVIGTMLSFVVTTALLLFLRYRYAVWFLALSAIVSSWYVLTLYLPTSEPKGIAIVNLLAAALLLGTAIRAVRRRSIAPRNPSGATGPTPGRAA